MLALIAEGRTNRQIGEKLRLAEKTVKNYVSGLLRKLGLERRTQAAVYELEHGRSRRPERSRGRASRRIRPDRRPAGARTHDRARRWR